jgi:hypothetical protein
VRELRRAGREADVAAFADELCAAWGDPVARRVVRFPLVVRPGRV